MSIKLYSGFIGSGKSYAAVSIGTRIVDAKFGKRYVIANFPVTPKKTFLSRFRKKKTNSIDRWIYKSNEDLTPEFLIKKSFEMGWNKKEGSCLVIFDEASIPFNTRSWNAKDRLDWIKFLTQSRKFGYDFVFITQSGNMLDKQIRSLCEYEVQHKNLNNMMYFKWLKLFRVTLFAGIEFWNGMNRSKGSMRLYFYRKSIADRYDTLNLFDYGKDVTDTVIDTVEEENVDGQSA